MARDNRASYFSIGLIVFLGLVAIAGALIYIGGLGRHGDEILAETYYTKPVGGLSVGSAVNFRGVRIGEVREISFIGTKYEVDVKDATRIYILLAIRRNMFGARGDLHRLVKAGLRATVSVNGITGIAKVDCDIDPDAPTEVKFGWQPQHLFIPPKVSLLENFADSATKVMNQINKMDLTSFWSNMNASVESVSALTLSSRHMMESYQPEFERTVKNLEEASAAARDFTETIRRDPTSLLRGETPAPLPETSR